MTRKALPALVVVFISVNLAWAQSLSWVRLDYPISSSVTDILTLSNGSLLCATRGDGVFFSSDHGMSWHPVSDGLGYLDIQDLCQSDSGVILAASAAGIFRFDTLQMQWNALPTPQNNYMKVFALGHDRILAAIYPGTLLSEDGGNTWSPTTTIVTTPPVFTDYMITTDGILFAGTQFGVYRSDDLGKTWSPSGLQGLTINEVQMDSRGRLHALVYYRGAGTYYSDDLGLQWTQHNAGLEHVLPWTMSVTASDSIFIGSVDGILSVRSSSDNSYSDLVPDGQFSHITCIEASEEHSLLIGTTFGGIYAQGNGPGTYRCLNSGMALGEGIFLGHDDMYIYAANPFVGIYRSPDAGLNWYPANTETGGSHLFTFDGQAEDLLLGTTIEIAWVGNLWRSTDHGMTWESDQEGIPLVDPGKWPWINVVLGLDRNSQGDRFALIDGDGVYQQISGTSLWYSISKNFPGVRAMCFCIGTDDNVYVGADDGAVYRSTNAGGTWETSIPGRADYWFHYMDAGPTGIIALRSQYGIASGTEGFLLPLNSETWQNLMTNTLDLHIRVMVADVWGSLFGATDSTGIIRSLDGGQSWSLANDGLGTLGVQSLAYHPTGYLFCGTADEGLFRARVSPPTHAERHLSSVNADLLTCFPNPFNATVDIRYTVNFPGNVRLEVFDILGRSVELLVSDSMPVGDHMVTWKAEHQASGLYLLKYSSAQSFAVTKIVLAK